MPTKPSAASATSNWLLSARRPMRMSASTTITNTAALMPNSAPSIGSQAAPISIEQAQAQHHQGARQHEQNAGNEPPAHAVQQPTDIGRELGCLRPRQQHAEIERVQEPRLRQPLFLVDHDPVHERDLPGRPAERQAADLEPDLEGFGEARRGQIWGVHVTQPFCLRMILTENRFPLFGIMHAPANCAVRRQQSAARRTGHRRP